MPATRVDSQLIDQIYEAAVATELWPSVLDAIGTAVGAWGGVFIGVSPTGAQWVASPGLHEHMVEYVAAGWAANPAHTMPLFVDPYPGFRAETAYRTIEEIEAEPVKAEFMIPRGLIAGAASVFQGSDQDALYLAIEGFQTHHEAEQSVARLDVLRPHIGRALSLSAKFRQRRDHALVTGLQLIGVGAAVIGRDSKLRAMNEAFEQRLGRLMIERSHKLVFTDRFLQDCLVLALVHDATQKDVSSVAVRSPLLVAPIVVHIIPLRNTARDIAESDGVAMIIANGANEALPNAHILRLLFDLTPAEARVARLVADGMRIQQISNTLGTSAMTVRTQLKAVFAKTGVGRQADLVSLLATIRTPPPL